eukprot:3256386-Rhodomonas_salina.3
MAMTFHPFGNATTDISVRHRLVRERIRSSSPSPNYIPIPITTINSITTATPNTTTNIFSTNTNTHNTANQGMTSPSPKRLLDQMSDLLPPSLERQRASTVH